MYNFISVFFNHKFKTNLVWLNHFSAYFFILVRLKAVLGERYLQLITLNYIRHFNYKIFNMQSNLTIYLTILQR